MPANALRHPVRYVRSGISSWIKSIREYRFLRSLGLSRRAAWRRRRLNHEYLRRRRPTP